MADKAIQCFFSSSSAWIMGHADPVLARAGTYAAEQIMPTTDQVFESLASSSALAKEHAGPVLAKAGTYAYENPGRTTMYVAGGAVILVPALVSGPALGIAGFGSAGPVAGTLAPWLQAACNPVVAKGAIATLQSAGMAGYGLAVVNGAVQVGAAGAIASAVGAELLPGDKKG